jgi:hypothetical protein
MALGLVLLPAGLLFIVLVVAALFLTAHDAPDWHLTSAISQQLTV